ncbi:choline kinase, partial [Tremellales sp. Uapishka_1]
MIPTAGTNSAFRAPPSPLFLASRASQSPPRQSSSSSTSGYFPHVPPMRRSSTGSFSALSEFKLDGPSADDDEEDDSGPATPGKEGSGVKGVRHVDLSVDGHEWKHPVFKTKVLAILRKLKVPLWSSPNLTPSSIHLQKVSGALTNAVFFLTFNPNPRPTSPSMSPMLTPTMPPHDPEHPSAFVPGQEPPTLLLRIYGPSSDALISRTEELRILHVLSSQYGLGPKVFGTFTNGRIEQFFPSRALTAEELKDRLISRGIARRMRELHSVDLRLLGFDKGKDTEPTLWRCLAEWVDLAEEVLTGLGAVSGKWEVWVEQFGLHRFRDEVQAWKNWVQQQDGRGKGVVFAHNDTQYGNLLKLDKELPSNVPAHHQYIVIDFEYAAPNPRGYDIANHFHEWRANYHHPTHAHHLEHFPYPSLDQREDFYRAYLSVAMDARNGEEVMIKRRDVAEQKIAELEREVRIWSPGCSAFWGLWGIIQADEFVQAMVDKREGYVAEFDNLAYALEKITMFRKEAKELGVPL